MIRTLKCEELSLCIKLDTSEGRMAADTRGGRRCGLIGWGGRGGVVSYFVCLEEQRSAGKG